MTVPCKTPAFFTRTVVVDEEDVEASTTVPAAIFVSPLTLSAVAASAMVLC